MAENATNFAHGDALVLRGYLPSLDGWRAIAIITVLIYHARDSIIFAWGARFNFLAHGEWGGIGVDLFFAISGLLITSRLLSEESMRGHISLTSFYLRRAFRILPPSLTYLAVTAILGASGIIAFEGRSWLAALLFCANLIPRPNWYVGHFWSLAVEEQFYAVWPLALLCVPKRRRFSVALWLCISLVLWRLMNARFSSVAALTGGFYANPFRTDFVVDRILFGAAIAIGYCHYASLRVVQQLLKGRVGLALFIAILISPAIEVRPAAAELALLFRTIAIPVILLTTILNRRGLTANVLENPVLKWVGRLSYSLYLWQQLFLVWNYPHLSFLSRLHRWPVNLICVFACAAASYYFIEGPCIRVGHRLASKIGIKKSLQVMA